MSFRPGSFAWLVAHDLRLGWRRFRSMFGKLRTTTVALIVGLCFAVFHLIAWPVAGWFASLQTMPGGARLYYPALASACLFVMPWLISQALTSATRALYSRGDLDLLFASPMPSRTILGAHAVATAIEALGSVAIFLVPIVNMNALIDGPHWLAVFPALVATALFATALGLCITLALFMIAGPRLTRVISQIAATIIGAGFVLALQAVHVLPAETRDSIVASIENPQAGSLFDRNGWLWLPVRAAAGETTDLLWWCAVSLAFFLATTVMLGNRFAQSAIRSASVAPKKVRERRMRDAKRFRANLGSSLRRKEWKLLARDPWLVSQILLQIIYTLPVAIVIWRSQGEDGNIGLSVAPAVVVIASQIAASLAWLAISSEDAAEFLATAPVAKAQIERRKLEAIALPLILFIAPPILGLAFFSLWTALVASIFCAAAGASTALLNLWHPKPGGRAQVLRRHSQSKLVGVMEHALSLLWAVGMVLAAVGSWLMLVPAAMALGLLWFNRPGSGKFTLAARAA